MKLLASTAVTALISSVVANEAQQYRYSLTKPNFSYWNDTNDDILTEFKTLMTVAERSGKYDREESSNLRTLQRFAELVDMIMYLQKVPFFGQYWYYGCWCAPEGFLQTVGKGYGTPVDPIDRSCRFMSECYECAQLDFGSECSTTNVNYRWRGSSEDIGNNKVRRSIICEDPEDTCQHAICSCDKKLAEDLALYEKNWDLHNHQKWGDFNREARCHIKRDIYHTNEAAEIIEKEAENWAESKTAFVSETESKRQEHTSSQNSNLAANISPSSGFAAIHEEQEQPDANLIGGRSAVSGETEEIQFALPSFVSLKSAGAHGYNNVKACCGKYPNRFPYKLGTSHECCNNVLYNSVSEQCCANGKTAPNGDVC